MPFALIEAPSQVHLLAVAAVVKVVVHRNPDNHPNILVVPVVDCVVDIDASSVEEVPLVEHTVIVGRVVVDIQWMPVVHNHMDHIRVALGLVVGRLVVVELVVDGTFVDSSEVLVAVVDIVLAVVVHLLRVLAGTLVVMDHWMMDSVVVERRRTSPFGSDIHPVSSLDYSTLPPSTPSDPSVQLLPPLQPPPLLPEPFLIFHVPFLQVVAELAVVVLVVVVEPCAAFDVVAASSSFDDAVVVVHMDSSVDLDTVEERPAEIVEIVVVAGRPSLCNLPFGTFVERSRRLHPFCVFGYVVIMRLTCTKRKRKYII